MGDSSDKNDKTQLLSDSQVLEVKPSPAKPPVEDKHDRSVWKGVVVGADEFALPKAPSSSGGRWLVLGILAVAGLGAGGYFAWTKFRAPVVVVADAAKPAVDAMPQDAAPVDAGEVASDAAVAVPTGAVPDDAGVDAAADAGVDAGVKPVKRKPPPKRMIKRKGR